MIHVLETTTLVPLPIERVFAFFSEAGNLARITPPGLGFRILTPGPLAMGEGTQIEYAIRVFGLPMRWKSLIRDWDPPNVFVDEQLVGPYKRWVHTHRFRPSPEGTMMQDRVEYELRFWPAGELVHPLVRRQLDAIFRYRGEAIRRILLEPSDPRLTT
jgi:ligand-binding SRPBCC domain-containing protein